MSSLFITSANEQLYEDYGYSFFHTFPKKQYDLIVYTEDTNMSWCPAWVKAINHWPTESPELFRRMNELKTSHTSSDYRNQPWRWCHKVAALRLGITLYSLYKAYDSITWIDFDTTFVNMPNPTEYHNVMSAYNKPIVMHDRTHRLINYPETGFIWTNSHVYMPGVNEYVSIYPHAPTYMVNLLYDAFLSDAVEQTNAGHDAYQIGMLMRGPLSKYFGNCSQEGIHKPHPQRYGVTKSWWVHNKGKAKYT